MQNLRKGTDVSLSKETEERLKKEDIQNTLYHTAGSSVNFAFFDGCYLAQK